MIDELDKMFEYSYKSSYSLHQHIVKVMALYLVVIRLNGVVAFRNTSSASAAINNTETRVK